MCTTLYVHSMHDIGAFDALFSLLIITYRLSLSRIILVCIFFIQNAPNWVLFNIASLYWRVKGDPSNALECLRRAIHYAPDKAADVGYLGMANVLHRVNYLNEAVITVRAALDIYRESVC